MIPRPSSERGTSNWRFEARKTLAGSSHSSGSANESVDTTEGERRRFDLDPEGDAGLVSNRSLEALSEGLADELSLRSWDNDNFLLLTG